MNKEKIKLIENALEEFRNGAMLIVVDDVVLQVLRLVAFVQNLLNPLVNILQIQK